MLPTMKIKSKVLNFFLAFQISGFLPYLFAELLTAES
jgi:hypothetical protein